MYARLFVNTFMQIYSYILNNSEEHDLVIISKSGQTIRTPLNSVSTLGRATQGVRVMRLEDGDKVASATVI